MLVNAMIIIQYPFKNISIKTRETLETSQLFDNLR